jgi:excisionase family DNA binding protein
LVLNVREEGYVTVAEAAQRLHVSHPTVWRWIKAGRLPAYRVGPKSIRIKSADLERLVQPVVAVPAAEATPEPAEATPPYTVRHTLTEDERQRGLAVLKALDAFHERMRAEHDGEPYPSSVDLIRQMREERTEELDRR